MKIKDVSRLAGVSPATVSRVLNGSTSVHAEYRERVLRAAAELGYTPNRLASNLRRQKAQMIGVVVPDIENPHFTQLVRAIEDAAYSLGYRVLLCNTDEQAEKQRSYLEMLAAERVLGVILSASDPVGAEIGQILDLSIPIVAVDRPVTDSRVDYVVGDNVAGARLATEHLIRLGHRHIGFVAGRVELETAADRLAGYLSTMQIAGLEASWASGASRIQTAVSATRTLLARSPRPTALLVGNNPMTIGALRVVREQGLRVPDDVALVGIDDTIWSPFLDPPLTALALPVRQMASRAVKLLLERISGKRSEPEQVLFPFELRVRESCGSATPRDGRHPGNSRRQLSYPA